MIKVKEDEMDSTCSTHGERRNVYRILVGNIKGKRPFGIPKHRLKKDTKMDLGELWWEGMDWIQLVHDWEQWHALVNMVMDLRSHKRRVS